MTSTIKNNNARAADTLRPLALLATGMSGADIERLVREVRARCRRKGEPLTWETLEVALRREDDGLSDAIRHRIAVHEIGHALCYELSGVGSVNSVRLHGLSGQTETLIDRERLQFPEGLQDHLVAIMGGRAAEFLVFGGRMVGSGGETQSDLALATRIAIDLETAFGIGEGHPLLYRPPSTTGDILHYNAALAERVHGGLEQAEQRAEELLRPYTDLIEALGRQLVAARVLEGATIRAALESVMAEGHATPPLTRRRSEGMARFDWSCFKVRCAHVDIGQLKSSGTYLKLCFCDSKHEAPDYKTWRGVTEPWKSDSYANAVTVLRSKDHSIEVLDVTRLSRRADRANGSGLVGRGV